METYDKNKIGKLIAWGGEHWVYEYDTDKVIKFSMADFLLRDGGKERNLYDYGMSKKYFGNYILDTEIVISINGKYIGKIQKKIAGKPLILPDLKNDRVRTEVKEIIHAYQEMVREINTEIDLIGRHGLFRRTMSNILVTEDNALVIFDASLLKTRAPSIFSFFIGLLRIVLLSRQNSTIRVFERCNAEYAKTL